MTGRSRRAGEHGALRGGQVPGAWRLVGWAVFLAACLAGLHAAGGSLSPPPLSEPHRLGQWLEQRRPAEAAVAVVRLVALGLAWYLAAVTAAGVLARATGAAGLMRAVDAVSVALVRRLVRGAVGLSLATTVAGGSGGLALAEPAPAPAAAATMRLLPAPAPPEGGDGRVSTPGLPPSMRLLPEPDGSAAIGTPTPAGTAAAGTPPPTSTPPPASTDPEGAEGDRTAHQIVAGDDLATDVNGPAPAPVAAGPGPERRPAGEERVWTVRPGDHLWAVAEQVLAEAWARPPSDAEVDGYWRALVDANRPRLRDPANPDLVFPGQLLVVPPPPAPPGPNGG